MQYKCYNCKEKFETKEHFKKVRVKGKIREWCDACTDGLRIYLKEKQENG